MLDSSLVICDARHPIFVQPLELIELYADTIRRVIADPERILGGVAAPRRPCPPDGAADGSTRSASGSSAPAGSPVRTAHALHTLNHVTPLGRPIRLTALAARNAERGEAMARDLGIERFTTEWADVVDDPNVDVVAVLLGETAHREATEAALALGKPVLCEKPLARDRFEAPTMLEAAQRAGRPGRDAASTTATCRPCGWLARSSRAAGSGRCLQFRAVYLQDHAAGARAEPPAERLPGHHRLRPHRRLPALSRERSGGRPGDRRPS